MKKFVLAALAAVTIASGASAQALDRRMAIINNSTETVVIVNGSNVTRQGWEENIIAGRPLLPGKVAVVDFNDGTGHCLFDLRVLTAAGYSIVRPGVDVCRAATWTLED